MHLVFFACPGTPKAALRDSYASALAPLGQVQIVWLTARGRSSAFTALAKKLRGTSKRLLPQLIKQHHGHRKPRSVSLVSYSAGYGFARELLSNKADLQALSGYVALDSIHADLDADGSAADHQLQGFVELAKRAQRREASCWIGHSDVATGGYASTTQTAQEIERLAGGQRGHFMVAAFDEYARHLPGPEHTAALYKWGPGFVAEAIVGFAQLMC